MIFTNLFLSMAFQQPTKLPGFLEEVLEWMSVFEAAQALEERLI